MGKMKLTYVVEWINKHAETVRTEVVVNSVNNSDGRQLAEQAAQRVVGAEARLKSGNQRVFFVADVPHRIEA